MPPEIKPLPAVETSPEVEDDFVPDAPAEMSAAATWQAWKRMPGPAAMAATLKTVRPLLDKAVSGNSNASKELLTSEAKRLAIGAIKTYDPSKGTALTTHIYSHLKPLRGYADKTTSVIHRTRTDNTLTRRYLEAQNELGQTLNRPPTDDELSDKLQVTGKDLEKMRRVSVGESSEEDFSSRAPSEGDPAIGLWADYVYSTLNPVSKKIFEMKTGRNGQPMLSAAEVAAKLGISEVYVNRRAGEIAQQILDGADALNAKRTKPEDSE